MIKLYPQQWNGDFPKKFSFLISVFVVHCNVQHGMYVLNVATTEVSMLQLLKQ